MGRDLPSPIGSADEAQTPPASAPEALEPLLAEATALLHQAFPPRAPGDLQLLGGRDDEAGGSVATVVEAAVAKLLRAVEVSRQAALRDPLTGLANRCLILDHLQLALARAGRRSTFTAVIFLDLDGFKKINDTFGHVAGDELLVRVALRLQPTVRPTDTLGRWGGDEFVVVCEDLERASDAPLVVERIAAAFEFPFAVGGRELHVAASIGVAVSAGADQPTTLLHAADSAMYQAKRAHPAPRPSGDERAASPAHGPSAKPDRLMGRLLEVLSSLEVDDPPTAAPEENSRRVYGQFGLCRPVY